MLRGEDVKRKLVGFLTTMLLMMSLLLSSMEASAKNVSDYQDVPMNAWYYGYVKDMSEKGIMTGLNANLFGTNDALARAQFATILYRMAESPVIEYESLFYDVKAGIYYSIPITWASGFGVVTGYANGNFGPADSINREQLATMLYRYAVNSGYDVSAFTSLANYPDGGAVSPFAYDAICWALGEGIITGDRGRINPQGTVNRAVCATMIARFLGYQEPEFPYGDTYVLNTNTKKFHYPSCRDVSKIHPENYLATGGTREFILGKGYSSCGHCTP